MLEDLVQLQTRLLSGEVDNETLESMKQTISELPSLANTPELNDIVNNIRVRLAVEIQKQDNLRKSLRA